MREKANVAATILPSTGGSCFELVLIPESGQVVVECKRTTTDCWTPRLPAHLLQSVGDLLCPNFASGRVPCFTEYRRGENNKLLFRAHPCYRSSGPWHDWAYFSWDVDDPDGLTEYPGKILFFCDLRGIDVPNAVYDNQLYAVIHSFHKEASAHGPSRLISHGSLSITSSFEVCDVETIADSAFVIPNHGKDNDYLVLPSCHSWSQLYFEE